MNINTEKLTIENKTKWVTKFKKFAKKLGFKWIPIKLNFHTVNGKIKKELCLIKIINIII